MFIPYKRVSLDSAFTNIFLLSKLFGTFPVSYKSKYLSPSKKWLIYSVLNCFLLLGFTILCLFYYKLSLPIVHTALLQVQFASMCCFITSSVVKLWSSIDGFNQILFLISHIDKILNTVCISVVNKSYFLYSYTYFCFLIVFYIIDNLTFGDGYFRTIYYYWTFALSHTLEILIIGLLDLLCVRFEALCRKLLECQSALLSIEDIMKCFRANKLLCDAALKINKEFSIPFLFMAIEIFIQIVTNLYLLISFSSEEQNNKKAFIQGYWFSVAFGLLVQISRRTVFLRSKVFMFILYCIVIILYEYLSHCWKY